MGPPTAHQTNTTDTTSNHEDDYGQQSAKDVFINLLLLMTTLAVVSLVYYIICYIMLNVQASAESAASESKSARRAAFIKENLLVHEWTDGDQDDNDDGNVSDDEDTKGQEGKENTTKHQRSVPCSGTNDDTTSHGRTKASEHGKDDNSACSTVSLDSTFEGCAICLAHYRQHQNVCESSNPACTHIFHEECMVNWLMKHHRCPICRQRYIAQTP